MKAMEKDSEKRCERRTTGRCGESLDIRRRRGEPCGRATGPCGESRKRIEGREEVPIGRYGREEDGVHGDCMKLLPQRARGARGSSEARGKAYAGYGASPGAGACACVSLFGRWVPISSALDVLASGDGRPGMLVIHKSWCGACKSLGPKFANSEAIQGLADRFVMINIQDDDDTNDPNFALDGAYYPRIYFLGSDGKPMPQYTSANPKYRHFFGTPEDIVAAMNKVLADWPSYKTDL